MTSKTRKFGGDFVLESRHLVGLFLLLVVIFGVVFTLGYLMGRSQGDGGRVVVASSTRRPDPPVATPPPAKMNSVPAAEDPDPAKKNSDWDFYHSADPQAASDHLQPVQSPGPASPAAAKPAQGSTQAKNPKPPKPAPALGGSLIPKGAIMLQVAAVLHQDDALALAQALQKKKFPAIVLPPSTDKYYRVQVGPYPDTQAAANARKDLEANGFKSITKR
ncbi:MAG TPA: SPOR domain-containing protein [Candidatus Acidoferrales bacterium]|jgi:septal ring-binding cell division protein DamX|nr:SPOR domain-containing protein [Candidatus Acidoferrales bacterium]